MMGVFIFLLSWMVILLYNFIYINMYLNYKGAKVYYEIEGDGEKDIVFLHGWGGSIKSFEFILKKLNFNYRALLIDFPMFGKSDMPKITYTIFDYEEIVRLIMQKENFNSPIVVGHSFGGRVAILLASKGCINGLVLAASAGLKPKRGLRYRLKIIKHKIKKKIGLKSNIESPDYRTLPQNMKKTFVNIVTTYLEKYAINISVPTILFWGKKDKDTPFYMAKRLKGLIKDSEIVFFKNSGHFCYIEQNICFAGIINSLAQR